MNIVRVSIISWGTRTVALTAAEFLLITVSLQQSCLLHEFRRLGKWNRRVMSQQRTGKVTDCTLRSLIEFVMTEYLVAAKDTSDRRTCWCLAKRDTFYSTYTRIRVRAYLCYTACTYSITANGYLMSCVMRFNRMTYIFFRMHSYVKSILDERDV
jgi:hypothetical protein